MLVRFVLPLALDFERVFFVGVAPVLEVGIAVSCKEWDTKKEASGCKRRKTRWKEPVAAIHQEHVRRWLSGRKVAEDIVYRAERRDR